MAATKVINRVDLSASWTSVTPVSTFSRAFFIAVKNTATSSDTVDVSKVTKVVCAIGIDSGVTNTPITIQTLTLNFKDYMFDDLKGTATFNCTDSLPTTFYIKPINIITDDGSFATGETAISIYINPVEIV